MVKTHRDYLIENHALDPQWNPRVQCACGRFTSADMCIDLSPLPPGIRQALGLESIDYICDGCRTRLFREQLVHEDEFYAMLDADVDALFVHNARDREHMEGLAERHPAHRPQFDRVTVAAVAGKLRAEISRSRPIIPVQYVEMRNQQSAQYLAYKYTLTNVEQPPDRLRDLAYYDAIDLATGEKVVGQPIPELLEVKREAGASGTEPDVNVSPTP